MFELCYTGVLSSQHEFTSAITSTADAGDSGWFFWHAADRKSLSADWLIADISAILRLFVLFELSKKFVPGRPFFFYYDELDQEPQSGSVTLFD